MLIIFDFDGTLADCKELHQTAFRQAIEAVNATVTYEDKDIEGRPTREKIRILQSRGWTIDSKKVSELKIINTQKEIANYIFINDELIEMLKNLYNLYTLTLASNASGIFIDQCLTSMKIKEFFWKINSATDFPAKPDTTMFIDCMQSTGNTPETTVIVEDSEVGIQCAMSTGASVIKVKNVQDTIKQVKEKLL